MPDPTESTREPSTSRLIGIGMGTRFLIDVTKQMFSPFLAVFASGMNISIVALGGLVGMRNAVGVTAPVFGAMADRAGYRSVLQLELALSGIGMLMVGASPNIWVLVLGMATMGIGSSAFVPTLQAYLSARLPYSRRARGLGIVEYAWALSNIVGLFAMGYLIQATSWRWPFLILGGGLLLSPLLFRRAPQAVPDGQELPVALARGWRSLGLWARDLLSLRANRASAWATIAAFGLLMAAGMNVSIVYGAWLQEQYSLQPEALGATALVVGFADLAGSVLVSLIADRLGKRRSVLGGMTLSLAAYALLPVLNVGLAPALSGIALVRFTFEFTVVSLIPLLSEQATRERGKVLALGNVLGLVGTMIASVTGPWAFQAFGVVGLAAISAGATLAAGAVVAARVREG